MTKKKPRQRKSIVPDFKVWYEDCITGMMRHIPDNSIDLVVADPPYGIKGETLDSHYNRNEKQVIAGYKDVTTEDYPSFTKKWIDQCKRSLRPGGSIYIISGYTNLQIILNALHESGLKEVNHLIGKFRFGVFTKKKFVSSHYHILFWFKPPSIKRTFNTKCRYQAEWDFYKDLQDVIEDIDIRRNNPKEKKNKNQLNPEFIEKLINYSSNQNDLIMDPFMGSLCTAKAALSLGRRVVGFEINKNCRVFEGNLRKIKQKKIRPIPPDRDKEAEYKKKRASYKRTRNKYK